jgi:CDP-paratose 2-epimerase
MKFEYVDKNREGDHICYISNLAKAKSHYPGWDVTKSLDDIFFEVYSNWDDRDRRVISAPSSHRPAHEPALQG